MAPPALPRALTVLLLLLLASTARSQAEAESPASAPAATDTQSQLAHSPVSRPPTAADPPPVQAPSSSEAHTPAPAPSHSHLAPAPAPDADQDKDDGDDDDKSASPAPAPAPAADQIKAANATAAFGDQQQAASIEPHREMNGGSKAGVVLASFAAAAVLGLGVFVWRKRRANIRRARYAEYAARMELV